MGIASIAHLFNMSNTFQTTFQHLRSANNLLNDGSLPPPLHPAPVVAAPPPSHTDDDEIRFIQGRTFSSLNLLHAGFRYSKAGKPLVDGRQSWRCVKRNDRCPGRLYTINDSFHLLGKPHSHPPDASDSNAREAVAKVKQLASTSTSTNARIYSAVTGSLPSHTMNRLPGEDALKKVAQRARRRLNPRPRAPTSLAELVLSEEDCKTLRGADMLLYDNCSDERRVIILATSGNLDILAESSSWYIDGTFKSSPQLFYQLLILHAELASTTPGRSWSLPCIYLLLTHKDATIYLEALQALVDNCPRLLPQVIMVDFEQALRSALSSTFAGAEIDGCYFHYCQAILRNLNQLGYKVDYESVSTDPATGLKIHSPLHTWAKRLMMLAMVPVDEVPAVFNTIVEAVPEDLQLDPLLGYFERTWIAGLNGRSARFPPSSWNQTDRVETELNRTNNYCESFNKKFSNVIGHSHPTIFNFLSAVQLEQASTEGKIYSYRRGMQPPQRKKKYLEKDAEVKHIVSTYHTYENNVLHYLDLLAEV